MSGRLILIDASVLAHKAIFQKANMLRLKASGIKIEWIPPVDYSYFSMVLSFLKKIVVKKEDQVIFCLDAFNSWRKFFYPEYKGNRKELRSKVVEINWPEEYACIEKINERLNAATDWQFIQVSNFMTGKELLNTEDAKLLKLNPTTEACVKTYGIEADDLIATLVLNNKEKEIIIVSIDRDLKQLCAFSNVRFFSVNTRHRTSKGSYDAVDDPAKLLADKIRTGDASDNIIVDSKNDTEDAQDIRKLIITLTSLPSWIQDPVMRIYNSLSPKCINYNLLPFQNSLGSQKRFNKIYIPDNEINYEDAIELNNKRAAKKKQKAKEVKKENNEKKIVFR